MFKRIIDFHLDKWKMDPFRKPLILRGARQVGKTYAVRRLGKQFKSAEVDYLIQRGEQILPIEVKSGHGNTLRSLHIFLESHPKFSLAIRFSSLNYSILEKLDSRPLYAAASLAHPNQKEALEYLVNTSQEEDLMVMVS
jgi:hypothetical protein